MKLKEAIKAQSTTKAPKRAKQKNGFVLYEGASRLDPTQQITAIITTKTSNKKIGSMYQLWILNKDINPMTASKTKKDNAVCGGCKLRQSLGGSCYVILFQAPNAIYKAYKKGNYQNISFDQYPEQFTNKNIRFGAYGDPAALPLEILIMLKAYAKNNTSYTHQWKQNNDGLKALSMASVDNVKEAKQATKSGWRYFRVASEESELLKNEVICPSVTHGTSCDNCNLCNGKQENDNRKNIVIPVHGMRAKKFKD